MNPSRFYMPRNIGIGSNMLNGMMTSNPIIRMAGNAPRNMGLLGRITSGIRSVNWGSLLNNANKTLNVVNQTIPLVRQAGPLVNNMKSMMRIAKAFGSETDNINKNKIVNSNFNMFSNSNVNNSNSINDSAIDSLSKKKEVQNDNVPNFFV